VQHGGADERRKERMKMKMKKKRKTALPPGAH
jgi:hypothetical protein